MNLPCFVHRRRKKERRKEKKKGLCAFQTRTKCACCDSWTLPTLFIFKDASGKTKRTCFSVTRLVSTYQGKGRTEHATNYIIRWSNTRIRRNVTSKSNPIYKKRLCYISFEDVEGFAQPSRPRIPTWSPRPGLFFASSWCFLILSALRASSAVCHSSTFTV
jgi:hypothetical protein